MSNSDNPSRRETVALATAALAASLGVTSRAEAADDESLELEFRLEGKLLGRTALSAEVANAIVSGDDVKAGFEVASGDVFVFRIKAKKNVYAD